MHISGQWRNHEPIQSLIGNHLLGRPWRNGLRIKNQGEMVIPLPLTLTIAQPWKPWKWDRSNLYLWSSLAQMNLLPS